MTAEYNTILPFRSVAIATAMIVNLMTTRSMRPIAFGIALLSSLAFASAGIAQTRHAFIVGNDNYQNIDQLKKAVNDARAIAQAVQNLGYRVTIGENLSRRDFNAKFSAFEGSIQPGDTVFVFYSGHGLEIDGANYLIPVDAPKVTAQQQSLMKDESISSDSMIQRLRANGALLQVFVLDACRDNPFRDKTGRSLGPPGSSLGPPKATRGLFVIYSAGNGEVALDRLSDNDPNPNSVFTRSLLPLLGDPNRSLISIAKETREKVQTLASSIGMSQFPGYYDQTNGDVFLAKTATGAGVASSTQSSQGTAPQKVIPAAPSMPPAPQQQTATLTPPVGQKNFVPADTGFIFPDSDRSMLTIDVLRGLSTDKLRLARNEIYARRGRFFKDPALAAYFSRFAWYRPTSWDVSLNAVEAANVKLIASMER